MTQSPFHIEDPATVLNRYAVWQATVDALIPHNKARLMACLATAGISRVTVSFNGEGDSGQIEDVQAYKDGEELALPENRLDLLDLPYGRSEPVARPMGIAEAIETLCYDLLRAKHEGWENSDGAYGDFEFLVEQGMITLDFNERFTSSENHGYSW